MKPERGRMAQPNPNPQRKRSPPRRLPMSDLSTRYLGLKLKNPLVASAGPLTRELDNIRRLEDVGASAIVFHSLFEEQIDLEANELDRQLSPNEGFAEAQSYLPELTAYNIGPEG